MQNLQDGGDANNDMEDKALSDDEESVQRTQLSSS
jgi:hypothetical protein